MAHRYDLNRSRHGQYRASQSVRPNGDPWEMGTRYDSRHNSDSRRDNRNRNNDGWKWSSEKNNRDDHADRRIYYSRRSGEDRRDFREHYTRDYKPSSMRRAFPDNEHRLEESYDRHFSVERESIRYGRDRSNERFDRQDTDQNLSRCNNEEGNNLRGDFQRRHHGDRFNMRMGRENVSYHPTVINFTFLSELSKKDPLDILMTLSSSETGLTNEMRQLFRRPFVARLLLSVLAKAFTCTSAPEKLHDLFFILRRCNFVDKTMEFFLQMQHEDRVHEQTTFRQSIMDMLLILREMNSFEKCKLSNTEFKGVKEILKSGLEYLKENTTDVIDDELLNAFCDFAEMPDKLTKCQKRGHNDAEMPELSGEVKKQRVDKTPSSTVEIQCFSQDPSENTDTDDNQQVSDAKDRTESECLYILECGHKCQARGEIAHTEFCDIDIEKTFPCGHTGIVKCYKKFSALCPVPCGGMLSCEHPCTGTCAECFQGRLHKPCEKQCKRILVCDHECTNKCNQCSPCLRMCENRCQHSKCIKRCGELCVPCKEKCTWNCEHFKCGKLCSEPCDRPRCDEPCKKKLSCDHQCIGLCGEPCPPDCRLCNKEKVTELFFGDEDEPDAKFVLLEDCRAECIIESKAMDRYMDLKDVEGYESEIKLKECPKCKTPIRKSNRYRHIINETLQDIERVKETVLPDEKQVTRLQNEIFQTLLTTEDISVVKQIRQKLNSLNILTKSEHTLVAIQNQLSLLKAILKLENEWKDQMQRENLKDDLETSLDFLQSLKIWVMQDRSLMTKEEISDAELEIARSSAHKKLILCQQQARDIGIDIDISLQEKISEAASLLKGKWKYEEQVRSTVELCLKELKEKLPQICLGVSEEEKLMIVKAMDFKKQGHWYKCPQGHIYVITECGGAMQESRCPECKSIIGGQSHQLRGDNQVASEMDGARFAAWSEQANMANYDPLEFIV